MPFQGLYYKLFEIKLWSFLLLPLWMIVIVKGVEVGDRLIVVFDICENEVGWDAENAVSKRTLAFLDD